MKGMNKQQKAKIIAIRSLVTILSVVIGVLVTAQWRSLPVRVTNPIAPYSSLKETRESLYEDQKQLKAEIKDLQQSIQIAQKEIEGANLSKDQLDVLTQKKALVGLTKLNGTGIIITYDDSKSSDATSESIIHAADLRDTLNVLWASGAEAIAINGQRVVINTAVDCIGNTILVNNTRISNPFRIEAIGDQRFLYTQLTSTNALPDINRRKSELGLIFTVEKNNDITVPLFDGRFEIKTTENS